MSVLVHWLDDEFSSQHRCLAVKRVPRSHCADSLAAQLNDVNKEWCLDPSSLHVVVSGASVMKEALSKVVNDFVIYERSGLMGVFLEPVAFLNVLGD